MAYLLGEQEQLSQTWVHQLPQGAEVLVEIILLEQHSVEWQMMGEFPKEDKEEDKDGGGMGW